MNHPTTDPQALDKAYQTMLSVALEDGRVAPKEGEMLKTFRELNNLTFQDHDRNLAAIGWSPVAWKSAVDIGQHLQPDAQKYGKSKYPTKYYHPGHYPLIFRSFLGHIFAIPRLRQFYHRGPNGKIENFWREQDERKASWTELFCDLVFVAMIFRMSDGAVDHLLEFIVCYGSMWSLWTTLTNYSTRYEPAHLDGFHTGLYFWFMFMVASMSLSVGEVYEGNPYGMNTFALTFILAQAPIIGTYFLVAAEEFFNPNPIGSSKQYIHPLIIATLSSLALVPWCVTTSIQDPTAILVIWFITLISKEVGVMLANMHQHKVSPICVDHWGERFALFVMIHLGEAMFSITTYFVDRDLPTDSHTEIFVSIAFSLAIPFAIRVIYFEIEREAKTAHALRRTRLFAAIWNFSHVILCFCLIVYSLGIRNLQTLLIDELFIFENSTLLLENATDPSEINQINNYTNQQLALVAEATWQPKRVFCIGLALVVAMIALQSVISTPPQDKYRLPRIQLVRFAVRTVLVVFLFLFHVSTANAMAVMATVACLFFLWLVMENWTRWKKNYHGSAHYRRITATVDHDNDLGWAESFGDVERV